MSRGKFIVDESPNYPGKYRICLSGCDELPFEKPRIGSYNVLAARVLGLDWVDYARYCRDVWDAEITGRNNRYVVVWFPQNEKTLEFLSMLNKRLNKILKELEKETTK